jgi:hypothetical protein
VCIMNISEHTAMTPNTNLAKPEFLIHQCVRVQ